MTLSEITPDYSKEGAIYIEPFDLLMDSYDFAKEIANVISGRACQNIAFDDYCIFEIFKNDICDISALIKERNFNYAKFRIVSYPNTKDELNNHEIYLEILAHAIIALRKKGNYVVFVGDIEDLISAKTGWNWTEDNPLQPDL